MQHDHPHKNNKNQRNEQGNAIAIVLVLIALLAALTAVSMRSSNRTSGNMDTETARIQAEKLMRTANTYESATQKLLTVNKCSENELSFENVVSDRDYTNATAPTDEHCAYFEMNGAGLNYTNLDETVIDTSKSALTDYGQWVFTATQCVLGLGSDDDDACTDTEVALIAAAPHINLAVCLQINTLNGITNPSGAPPEEFFDPSTTPFTGTFDAATDAEIGEGATGVNFKNHGTGCIKVNSGTWSGSYVFYHTLLNR